jgi:thiol-disulfide isomerase/thioredoxin
MLERILVLAVVVALSAVVYAGFRLWNRRRLQHVATRDVPVELVQLVDGTRPVVLYFTTPECAQCRLQQAPILNQLAAKVDVAVHKLDAIEQDALARFYGIMTVPTTVVLDRNLRPVAVNHGVTPFQRLQAQIEATDGSL